MSVHPDLEWARDQASRFRVRKSDRGFNVWVFHDWERPAPGWRIIVADVKSEVDGWLHVLAHLGLIKDKPPLPLPPRQVIVRPADEEESW